MNKTSYALDNAAKIYPAAMNKKWNSVFRVSVYLRTAINPTVLKRAVYDLSARFPTFYTQLHKGFLWDALVPANDFDIVSKETDCPCRPMTVGTGDKPMFRVLYSENQIAVEFFHAVTDGNGAMIYLKTLTARYLELLGYSIPKTDGVLDCHDVPTEREICDSFQEVYKKEKRQSRAEENAYQYTAKREKNFLKTTSMILSLASLKKVTKSKYNCTVTEYLAGVYAFAFIKDYKAQNKSTRRPVKISVPVNLRPYYGSETLRNFASFVNVSVYPGKVNCLSDAIRAVKKEMDKKLQIEKIEKAVIQNVAEEKMLITKIAPNILKKTVMKFCFMNFGERKYTGPLSNLGLVKVPSAMQKHIDRFEFIIGETPKNCIYCTAVGFGNKLTVTLSSVTKDNTIEEYFSEALKSDGILFETKQRNSIAA